MAKDPAVLFYTSDFLTGTMLLSNDQKGKYITLLCLQHQRGVLYEKDMLNICGTYDKDIWDKFIQTDGTFYNKRMKEEAEKRAKYSLSRSTNRLKGTENKEVKPKKKKKSYDNHMENENEDINENRNTNDIEVIYPFNSDKFMQTWEIWVKYRNEIKKPYRSKISEQAALKMLSKYDEATAMKMIEQSLANTWQGIFEIKTNGNKHTDKREQVASQLRDSIENLRGTEEPKNWRNRS